MKRIRVNIFVLLATVSSLFNAVFYGSKLYTIVSQGVIGENQRFFVVAILILVISLYSVTFFIPNLFKQDERQRDDILDD